MKVICTDGTAITCESFRAVDSGVLLFDEPESERDDEEAGAIGFVPITELRYVLPDEVQPGQQPAGAQAGMQRHRQAGSMGGQPPQPPMQQQPGGQPTRGSQSPQGPGQQSGPGRQQ